VRDVSFLKKHAGQNFFTNRQFFTDRHFCKTFHKLALLLPQTSFTFTLSYPEVFFNGPRCPWADSSRAADCFETFSTSSASVDCVGLTTLETVDDAFVGIGWAKEAQNWASSFITAACLRRMAISLHINYLRYVFVLRECVEHDVLVKNFSSLPDLPFN